MQKTKSAEVDGLVGYHIYVGHVTGDFNLCFIIKTHTNNYLNNLYWSNRFFTPVIHPKNRYSLHWDFLQLDNSFNLHCFELN